MKGLISANQQDIDASNWLLSDPWAYGEDARTRGNTISYNWRYKDDSIRQKPSTALKNQHPTGTDITIKEQLMYEILLAKATQNPQIAKALLETGTDDIIENTALATYDDLFWGNGGKGQDKGGRNALGKAWMAVRETLREELKGGNIRIRRGLSDSLAKTMGHEAHVQGSQYSGKVITQAQLDAIQPKKLASEVTIRIDPATGAQQIVTPPTPLTPQPAPAPIPAPSPVTPSPKPQVQSASSSLQEGYFDWLKSKGVQDIMENARKDDLYSAKSVYIFDNEANAQGFKNQFLSNQSKFGSVFFDTRAMKYAVPINPDAVDLLKGKFREEHASRSLEAVDAHLKSLDKAISDLERFDKIQTHTSATRFAYKAKEAQINVDSRIEQTAKLLSNQTEGWWEHSAASSIDLMMSVYKAKNFDLLSAEDMKSFDNAQALMLQTDAQGRFVGGLKADANFVSFVKENMPPRYTGDVDYNKIKRVNLIREDVSLLLDGGERAVIDRETPHSVTTLKDKSRPKFNQPRFFPTATDPGIDTLVLQAGGMAQHSSMRILKKEKDDKVPGGYRYFYTKADAGGGLEEANHRNKTGTSIYTTEITPRYKLKSIGSGKSVVEFNVNGEPTLLTEAEFVALKAKPEEYQAAMKATLFALLSAEREILPYKNPDLAVGHGESAGITARDKFEWNFHNNKIKALRGTKVPERCIITPYQLSGNCTVFSAVRTIEALTNTRLANDMLQDFKRYSKGTIEELKQKRTVLVAERAKIQDQMAAPKAPRYTTQELTAILDKLGITGATIKIIKDKDDKDNYFVTCQNNTDVSAKAVITNWSSILATKHGIKGASGNNKYPGPYSITTESNQSQNEYGIVLIDDNISDLAKQAANITPVQPAPAPPSPRPTPAPAPVPKPIVNADFAKLIQSSQTFAQHTQFLSMNNLISAIAGNDPIKQAEVVEHAKSTRPIVDARFIKLAEDFLEHKKQHGTAKEKDLYQGMSIAQFTERLLTQRPLMFMNEDDEALLRDGRRCTGGFESIGTVAETPPLVLKDYLSYAEMELAALVSMSTPTHFINNGSKYNEGKLEGALHEDKGVLIGSVGTRFEKPGAMEYKHMIIDTNCTLENGYGAGANNDKSRELELFAKFYNQPGGRFPSYAEAQQDKSEKYINLGNGKFLNKEVYKERLRMSIEPFLAEANQRAADQGKQAYVHASGIGLGVWAIPGGKGKRVQSELMVEVYQEILERNKDKFTNISDVDFAYFDALDTNYSKPTGAGKAAINFSRRNASDKLSGKDSGKLLVAQYAWDSNSYPGNEYWEGSLSASMDPAAACSSTIVELQNPQINPEAMKRLHVINKGQSQAYSQQLATQINQEEIHRKALEDAKTAEAKKVEQSKKVAGVTTEMDAQRKTILEAEAQAMEGLKKEFERGIITLKKAEAERIKIAKDAQQKLSKLQEKIQSEEDKSRKHLIEEQEKEIKALKKASEEAAKKAKAVNAANRAVPAPPAPQPEPTPSSPSKSVKADRGVSEVKISKTHQPSVAPKKSPALHREDQVVEEKLETRLKKRKWWQRGPFARFEEGTTRTEKNTEGKSWWRIGPLAKKNKLEQKDQEKFHDVFVPAQPKLPKPTERVLESSGTFVENTINNVKDKDKANLVDIVINQIKALPPIPPLQGADNIRYTSHQNAELVQRVVGPDLLDFKVVGNFSGVLSVERISEGKLLPNSIDIIEYKDGKVVSVVLSKEGKCRVHDIDSKSKEAKIVIDAKGTVKTVDSSISIPLDETKDVATIYVPPPKKQPDRGGISR